MAGAWYSTGIDSARGSPRAVVMVSSRVGRADSGWSKLPRALTPASTVTVSPGSRITLVGGGWKINGLALCRSRGPDWKALTQ